MQQNILASPVSKCGVLLAGFLLIFSYAAFSQGLATEKRVSSRTAYAHLFNLVIAADSMDRGGINQVRSQTGLTDRQYEFLRTLAYQFDSEFPLAGKGQMALPDNYKARLRGQFRPAVFAKLDRFVMSVLAPRITVVTSGDAFAPEEFSYSSSIIAEEATHILRGTSITVTFSLSPSSPQDICSVTATMTGTGVSESGGNSGTCGNDNPRVVLLAPNYQVNSQYCIAGSHLGPNGQTGTSNACATTTNPPRISKVEYEQILTDDALIDANPNVGGGRRIFPDMKIPNETTVDRRKIRVKATYSAATAGVSIYFRNFDMDDPSASTAPLDTNDTGGVNGGEDNYGNVNGNAATRSGLLVVPGGSDPNPYSCQAFTNGMVSGVVCQTDSAGVAKVDYIVTRQPGDNFSVTASTDETHSLGLVLTADGDNVKDVNHVQMPVTTVATNGCANYSFKTCRAEMITVWRRVHMEVDEMGTIGTGNNVTGTINGTVTIPRWNGLQPAFTTVALNVTPSLDLRRFERGRLLVGHSSLFVEVNNATNTVEAGNATSRNIVLNNGAAFTLYDDDDYNSNDTLITSGSINFFTHAVDGDDSENFEEFTDSRRNLLAADGDHSPGNPMNVYGSAYVRPEYNWAQNVAQINQLGITFDESIQDLGTTTDELNAALTANRGSAGSESNDFWVAYFLIGYQGNTDRDADGCVIDPQTMQCKIVNNDIVNEGGVSGISRRTPTSTAECDCYQSTACPAAAPPNAAPTTCTGFPTGAFGSLMHHEVQMDVVKSWLLAGVVVDSMPTTAPHELGHQFGLKGDQVQTTFRFMDYSLMPALNVMALHPEHINLIRRRVASPGN
jgi:hypothetical protein